MHEIYFGENLHLQRMGKISNLKCHESAINNIFKFKQFLNFYAKTLDWTRVALNKDSFTFHIRLTWIAVHVQKIITQILIIYGMYWCSQAELALSRQNYRIIKTIRIPLAPRGDLAPGSAQARPSAWPLIDSSGNFPVHVSAESP